MPTALASYKTTTDKRRFFYDFSGERVIKSRSSGRLVYVNGQLVQSLSGVHDNFTTYVNPYLVVETPYEYTKFVYMGSRRMVAKIGDGSAETPAKPDPRGNEPNTDYENLQFFFHSDHLGSTSYMTDLSGEVAQHVEYFPYGGIMTEERNSSPEANTPYLFNGKELDVETGLYYYGARYLDSDDGWLGVDPLAEKYPNVSPYSYTMGNPIMLIDPDGREVEGVTRQDAQNFKEDIHNVLSDSKFDNLRGLIDTKGRKLKQINSDALSGALGGIELSVDEKTYVDMVINTINSKDVHKVEYVNISDDVSLEGGNAINDHFNNNNLPSPLTPDGTLKAETLSIFGGEGFNTPTKKVLIQ